MESYLLRLSLETEPPEEPIEMLFDPSSGKRSRPSKRIVERAAVESVHTHGFVAMLLTDAQSGFVPRYRTFVSWADLWAGHVRITAPEPLADSIAEALGRQRQQREEAV